MTALPAHPPNETPTLPSSRTGQVAGDVDLAAVAAVIAEPARTRVLLALTDGRALPASMLAAEAGVSAPTASHHLTRLREAGLITCTQRGRYRYYRLAGPAVADLIETIARLAPAQPIRSLRQGTRANALRYARSCYDHLAGRLGIAVLNALKGHDLLQPGDDPGEDRPVFMVTAAGAQWFIDHGIASTTPGSSARGCRDWTEQEPHLAGALGRQLLTHMLDNHWLDRYPRTRALRPTDTGRRNLHHLLGIEA